MQRRRRGGAEAVQAKVGQTSHVRVGEREDLEHGGLVLSIHGHVEAPAHHIGSAARVEAFVLAEGVQLLDLSLELLDVLERSRGLPFFRHPLLGRQQRRHGLAVPERRVSKLPLGAVLVKKKREQLNEEIHK